MVNKFTMKSMKPNLAPNTLGRDQGEPELQDDSLKRETISGATVVEIETVKGFYPKHYVHGEGTHNGATKRVTTPGGNTVVGVKTLSFCSEKPSRHTRHLKPPTLSPS
jgi:hypothetical protein